jgi:hypothetical protein
VNLVRGQQKARSRRNADSPLATNPESTLLSGIDRWQAGRSPRALPIQARGEAVCHDLSNATLGADRHLRSAPFFAGALK